MSAMAHHWSRVFVTSVGFGVSSSAATTFTIPHIVGQRGRGPRTSA